MNFLTMAYVPGGLSVAWLIHMVIGSIVNGLIFSLIFRVMRHLSTGEAVLLVVVVIGGLFLWVRTQSRPRW